MPKKNIFVAVLLILTINLFSQETINSKLSSIEYSNPQKYEIGGITISGVKYLDHNALIHLSGLKVGSIISVPSEDISEAIKKLWKQGLFSDIKITATKIISDKIFLDIYLKERPRLSKFAFSGVKKGEATDLRDEIKLIRGSQVTDNVINNTINTIKKFYINKGFLNVEVNISQKEDTLIGNSVILKINVDKKNKVKINDIVFEGNNVLSSVKLRRAMKETKIKRWFRLFKASKFISSNYEEDKNKIIAKYNENGYRDAKIVTDTVYPFDDKTIQIKMKIKEGDKYYFRNIAWIGNTKYNSEFLDRVLGIKNGDVYDESILNKKLFVDDNAVSSLYLDNGYLFFSVTPVEVMVENDSIDLELRIYEGKQARINKVTVTGNTRTHDHVVRREIRTKPGQLFSRSDIIRTNRELATLGYFDPEKLDVRPVPNPANGTVDIEYVVEEKASDQIELSGGWGGGMVIGTLGLTFNNFSARNLFNGKAWRPLPSGDGQQLSIRAQTNGTFYQAYSMSFVEPWLGGKKPNSLSVSIYHTIRTLGNYIYQTDQRMKVSGLSVGLGRRLSWPDDFFTLSNSISYQRYDLHNYDYYIFSNGTSNNISLSTTFSRNSVDQPIYPRRGSLFSLSLQLTPPYSLFNDKDYSDMDTDEKYNWIEYHKWKFKSAWYTTLVDKLVLYTNAELGYLGYYNKTIGPSPFESFQLGGDGLSGYNMYGTETIALRGYDNGSNNRGSLTPSNGGNLYTKYTAEIRYPVSLNASATIYVLTFAEAGNAWYDIKNYSPFNVKRSVGVGVKFFLPMLGMLGLDWGYGFDEIPGQPDANKGQFAFSIGQRF
ncbi:MAG: outer membrane protein assembly factor BamA [Bacteroidetes bacterium]|nr:MAG: outer membrane protein assembly factor BamA [Bacteroidota bacterium]